MVELIAIAVLVVGAYALALRCFDRANPFAVFLCLAAVLFSGAVLLSGVYGLWSLRSALAPSFRNSRIWIWSSVWQDAALASLCAVVGVLLLWMLFAVRRTNHLTNR